MPADEEPAVTADEQLPPRLTALALLLEVALRHGRPAVRRSSPRTSESPEKTAIQQAVVLRAENLRLRQQARDQISRSSALTAELRATREGSWF